MRPLALLVLVVLGAVGCGGEDEPTPLISADRTAVVRGELVPSVHLFGEPVEARIDVVLDRGKVDPADVRLETDFEPYEEMGEARMERQDIGRYTVLRYSTALSCLSEKCIPRTAAGETTVSQLPGLPPFLPGQQRDEKVKFQFPPALLVAESEPDARTLGRVVWAPLRSLSRINWDDSSIVGQGFPFTATVTPLPEPEYRVSPTLLGLALLALALALVAVPLGLLWRSRRRRSEPAAKTPALSPLERALRLVEWASRRPSAEVRREALEALAYELDADERAAKARKHGWSPPTPEPAEMTELVSAIRKDGDAPST
jgi:hypothetical protein